MTGMTDQELVEASRAGDQGAFGELVRRYQRLVEAAAMGASGLRDVDDVVQDTFVTAWRTLDRLRDDRALRAWLYGIARNLARKARRARRAHVVDVTDTATTPFDAVVQHEREREVSSALACLPARYREPLVLFYYEHCTVKEVAAALALHEDAAMQRLSRGRRKLGEELAARVETVLESRVSRATLVAGVVALLPARTASAAPALTVSVLGRVAMSLRVVIAMVTTRWRVVGGVLGSAAAVAVVIAASVKSEAVAAKAVVRAPQRPALPQPADATDATSTSSDDLPSSRGIAIPDWLEPSTVLSNYAVASDDPVESCARAARGLVLYMFGRDSYRFDGADWYFEPSSELVELADAVGTRTADACDIGTWPELYVRCEATADEALAGNVTCYPYDYLHEYER